MLIKALLCVASSPSEQIISSFFSSILVSLPFSRCSHAHTKKSHRMKRRKNYSQSSTIFTFTGNFVFILCSLFFFFLPNEWGRNQKTEKYLRLSPSNQHDLSLMLGHIHTMPAALLLTFIGLSCEGGRGNCEKHEWRQESRDYFQLKRSSKYKIACKVIGWWTWGSLFLEERDQQEKFRKNFFFSCEGGGGGHEMGNLVNHFESGDLWTNARANKTIILTFVCLRDCFGGAWSHFHGHRRSV